MNAGFRKTGLAAASVFALAACSADAPPLGTPPGGGNPNLTAAETAALNEALVGKAFQGWGFDQAASARVPGEGVSLSAVPVTIDYSVDVAAPCEIGGTAGVQGSISGSIDDQTFDGTLSLDIATSLDACAFPADQTVFTVTTNPDLVLQGSVAWDQNGQVGDATFTYVGGFTWNTDDGRAGSCSIDVSVTLAQDGSESSIGSVCGQSV